METTKILTANFLDILFEGRNKEYGAYELRTSYQKRMWLSLAITAAIFLFVATAAYLKNTFAKPAEKIMLSEKTIVDIKAIADEKPEELPPPPTVQKVEMPKVQTIKLTVPIVVNDKDVAEPPPTQTDIAESKISTITQAGIKDMGLVTPPEVVDGNRGIIATPKVEENDDKIFEKVEIDAKYPGGTGAWKGFLERNLRGDTPVENSASPGTYTVIIQFVVDKQGNVSDIKPLTNLGYGMEAEAMRVIKKSGRWTPAIQNGNTVTAYRKQPITFQVLEQ